MHLSLFYPVRRGSWRRSILLIVKERERKREGKKRRETRHACAFSPIHREGIESGEGKRRRRCSRGMESVVEKMPRGMLVQKDGRRRDSFIQADLFTSSFLWAHWPFVSLFTHRRFPSLSLRYCVSYGNTSATSSRFSFLYGFQDYSILQIVNFRRENLSRGACSGIVNRNIDNYGYNVSRIIN